MKPRIVARRSPAEGAAATSLQLHILTTALALSAIAAVTFALLSGLSGSVEPGALTVLFVLTVAASQRVRVFGDETAINTSMVVLLAAAGLAARGGPLWVPATCGVVAGLHWDHVRNVAVRRLVVNASCSTLAVLASSVTGRIVYSHVGSSLGVLVPIIGAVAVCVYWLVDNGLVALVLSAVDRSSPRRHLIELTRSETQILPFALAAFSLALVVPSTFGDLAFAASLMALVLVADVVVVQSRYRLLARRLVRLGCLPSVLVALIAALVVAGANEGVPTQAAFPLLLATGLIGSLALAHRSPTLTMFAPTACAVTAVIALGTGHALFPLLAIGMSACLVPSARLPAWSARLMLLCAAGVSAIAISSSFTLAPSAFVSSIWGTLFAAAVAGLAGLVAWHSVVVLALMVRSKRADLRLVLGNAYSDLAAFALAGLVGGASGWALLHAGLFASAVLLGMSFAVAALTPRSPKFVLADAELADDHLLDLLQSALLDLPASRLPEE